MYIRQGPASLAPQVWDLGNGLYEVMFLAMEPGHYSAQITLDFTLCDGLREPPVDWFITGLGEHKIWKCLRCNCIFSIRGKRKGKGEKTKKDHSLSLQHSTPD